MSVVQKRDQKALQDVDFEALLAKLTDAEIEELHTELIDPDDSMVPPSDRCRYKTDKEATGPFNRKHLLDYLEKKAKEDKDWEEPKPYTKETRGKVWKPKEEEKIQIHDDEKVQTEWDEVLAAATEEELVDLAAILGFHGMLNQVQYHQAFVEGSDKKDRPGGFQGVAKADPMKTFPAEQPNEIDVDKTLQRVKSNDPSIKDVNLNNIKKISIEMLCEFAEALKTNTNLEKLHMANTRATDKVAKTLAASLKENKTLKSLNLESNYISGGAIIQLLEAINVPQVLTELRVSNQRPQVLGVRNEMTIAQLLRDNKSLLTFGSFLEVRAARVLVSEYLQRNNDNVRRERMGKEIILPPVDETPYYLRKKPGEETKKKTEESDEE